MGPRISGHITKAVSPAHTSTFLSFLSYQLQFLSFSPKIYFESQCQRAMVKRALGDWLFFASSCKKFSSCCQHLKTKKFHIKIDNLGFFWKWEHLAIRAAFSRTMRRCWGAAWTSKTGKHHVGTLAFESATLHLRNVVTDSAAWGQRNPEGRHCLLKGRRGFIVSW